MKFYSEQTFFVGIWMRILVDKSLLQPEEREEEKVISNVIKESWHSNLGVRGMGTSITLY